MLPNSPKGLSLASESDRVVKAIIANSEHLENERTFLIKLISDFRFERFKIFRILHKVRLETK